MGFVRRKEKGSGLSKLKLFESLLSVIEKVKEGSIGKFRYVAFEITPDEIEKELPRAREAVADMLDDVLSDFGVPDEERRRAVQQVAQGLKNPYDIFYDYGIEPGFYFPNPEEVAAENVLRKALEGVPNAPPDPQASEEPGYILPEYSLYWNPDARSWVGRWYWSGGASKDICWALIADEEICKKVSDMVNELDLQARQKGRQLLFAIWKTRR